jgi:hypothetical protein
MEDVLHVDVVLMAAISVTKMGNHRIRKDGIRRLRLRILNPVASCLSRGFARF